MFFFVKRITRTELSRIRVNVCTNLNVFFFFFSSLQYEMHNSHRFNLSYCRPWDHSLDSVSWLDLYKYLVYMRMHSIFVNLNIRNYTNWTWLTVFCCPWLVLEAVGFQCFIFFFRHVIIFAQMLCTVCSDFSILGQF